MTKHRFKTYYRAKYNFWSWVARFGHAVFRLGQWRSFHAYDKMGGRHIKTTRPLKNLFDFLRKVIYNNYIATRDAMRKLNKEH